MAFLMTDVAFDVTQILWRLVFLCYLGGIDPNGWMPFSSTALVFFRGLSLRLISKGRGAVGLSLALFLEASFWGSRYVSFLSFLADSRWPFRHLARCL